MSQVHGRRGAAWAAIALLVASCTPGDGGRSVTPTAGTSPAVEPLPTSLPPVDETTRPSSSTTNPFTPPPTLAGGETVCDRFTVATTIGALPSLDLNEVSGIAASRRHTGTLWVHNDSGDQAAVYAVDPETDRVTTVALSGVFPLDWEDIAIGPGPDRTLDYLYIADIGDNFVFRTEVTAYRIVEPDPSTPAEVTAEALFMRYPDGPHDAEALAVDPITGSILVVTKAGTDGVARAYAGTSQRAPGSIEELTFIGTIELGPGAQVTGADMSPDGTLVALRGYEQVWLWQRSELDLGAVLQTEPCLALSPVEVQGEAITFLADGNAYVTATEGAGTAITRVDGG